MSFGTDTLVDAWRAGAETAPGQESPAGPQFDLHALGTSDRGPADTIGTFTVTMPPCQASLNVAGGRGC